MRYRHQRVGAFSAACCGLCSIPVGQGCDIDVTGQSIHVSYNTDGGHTEHGGVGGPEQSKYFIHKWKSTDALYQKQKLFIKILKI